MIVNRQGVFGWYHETGKKPKRPRELESKAERGRKQETLGKGKGKPILKDQRRPEDIVIWR